MKTEFTKGKWRVDDTIENIISVVSPWCNEVNPAIEETFGDYRGANICEMHYNSRVPTRGKAIANAKLIAAAPDLFWALCSLVDTLEGRIDPDDMPLFSEIQEANKTIKKATE